MHKLLYLVHRLPYPPNKGDKLRSYHLLRHLAENHRMFLGTFVDAREDVEHVESLRAWCSDICAIRLSPSIARLRSLSGLLTNEALTVAYYRNAALQRWIHRTVRDQAIDTCVVFSSAMSQYVLGMPELRHIVIDFVDVDSAKWTEYANRRRWPLSWLYRREGAHLLAFERTAARRAGRSFFVTDAETAFFRKHAPESAIKCDTIGNGVDCDFFSPGQTFESPYPSETFPIAFTGAMDYWPNSDAVRWFAAEVLPAVRLAHPEVRFTIVGMRPGPEVRSLASPDISVTGTVADVRPYIRHAGIVVAPLRVARGIQNKILEAMAMARPVIASVAGAEGLSATEGRDYVVARDACEFIAQINSLIDDPNRRTEIGTRARACVHAHYNWHARLACIDPWLAEPGASRDARDRVALLAGADG